MNKKSLTKFALRELDDIFRYSKRLNKFSEKKHAQELLEIMAEHIQEIRERYQEKDAHYLTETGDLLILCFSLLKEAKISLDAILNKCYKRYRKKLPQLIKEIKPSRKVMPV
jgi:NTP pyrophosphatase (non-canonical NTP hydrolase)